ncbi:ABC transporter substrate-binding protein [Lachnospiraceae bacterium]|nr:ABC transporter substrate-binding protein [uncultured Schaedlerella sp.]MCI8768896.1 ABC transporter substrate-binding protein [Ruminococcus sp.]NBJ02950.1 ABC transporter substrate-binding protein [Lachnospiraceae bacterium]
MKRKVIATLLAATMVMSLAACGSGGDNGSSGGDAGNSGSSSESDSGSSGGGSGDSIRLVNGKIEIDSQLKKLAEMYKEETGVTVEIESMGGGIDIQGTLKGYYQADNMPDIFVNGGSTDFGNWEGMLEDMSGEAWASDTDAAYVDEEYGTIGFPYTVEAVGLAYNADILEKAEIDPATLTSPDKIEEAFKTLDSKKADLGLDAVVGYCAEATNLYWSTGNHLFANYIDGGLDRDDTTYIDMLNDGGKVDKDRLTDFAEFVGLLNQYSDPALLVSGTYDQQILNFASGKYAFVTQGSWIGATITGDDAEAYEAAGNFKVGMVPYAFEDGMDTILTNSPSWWSVFSDGNAEAAKAFLQWCSEDKAQQVLVEEAGFISPYNSCKYVANDPFAQTIVDYQTAGKTSGWHWLGMKEGLAQNYTGQVFSDYAAGNLDTDKFVQTMEQVIQACYAN